MPYYYQLWLKIVSRLQARSSELIHNYSVHNFLSLNQNLLLHGCDTGCPFVDRSDSIGNNQKHTKVAVAIPKSSEEEEAGLADNVRSPGGVKPAVVVELGSTPTSCPWSIWSEHYVRITSFNFVWEHVKNYFLYNRYLWEKSILLEKTCFRVILTQIVYKDK